MYDSFTKSLVRKTSSKAIVSKVPHAVAYRSCARLHLRYCMDKAVKVE